MNKQRAKEIGTDEQTYVYLKDKIESQCRHKKECVTTPEVCSIFKYKILEALNRF